MIGLNEFMDFSSVIDQAFANKRKGIKNNLKKLNVNLEELKINPLARAEELSIEEFIVIFKASRV
jgi:16S rRNA A1518/A1519 N6-dimethyltransferase RsmA/KsgA/DIM1 with predicted DNA glycosylase/AP lyase activity